MRRIVPITLNICVSAIFLLSTLATYADSLPRILIGSLQKGKQVSASDLKVEAGLALAVELTEKYILISGKEADSISKTLPNNVASVTALTMANATKASKILFVRVDRLENVIRAEIQLAHAPDFKQKTTGVGFALIRYRTEKKNEQVLDPALLLAFQRAFAVAIADSTVYAQQKGSLEAYPAPPLVIGGLQYINNTSLVPWVMFQKTEVQAFDAVLTIFDVAKDSKNFVCFDADTRDSIFALFHLHMLENNNAPSVEELDALYKLEVRRYITGTVERTDSGAHITLSLSSITEGGRLTQLQSLEDDIDEDNIMKFREKLSGLTGRLLGLTKK